MSKLDDWATHVGAVSAQLDATLARLAPKPDAPAEAPTPCVTARPTGRTRTDTAPKRVGKVDRRG